MIISWCCWSVHQGLRVCQQYQVLTELFRAKQQIIQMITIYCYNVTLRESGEISEQNFSILLPTKQMRSASVKWALISLQYITVRWLTNDNMLFHIAIYCQQRLRAKTSSQEIWSLNGCRLRCAVMINYRMDSSRIDDGDLGLVVVVMMKCTKVCLIYLCRGSLWQNTAAPTLVQNQTQQFIQKSVLVSL